MVFILIVIMTREYSNPCVRERYWVCVCVGKFGLGIGKFGLGIGKFGLGIGKFDRDIGKFGKFVKSKNFFKGVGGAQRTLNNIKDMPSALFVEPSLTVSLPCSSNSP